MPLSTVTGAGDPSLQYEEQTVFGHRTTDAFSYSQYVDYNGQTGRFRTGGIGGGVQFIPGEPPADGGQTATKTSPKTTGPSAPSVFKQTAQGSSSVPSIFKTLAQAPKPQGAFSDILPGLKQKQQAAKRPGGLMSFKKGTKKVPKTGVAKVHKGEAILNKKQAKKYRKGGISAAAGVMGAGKKKSKTKRRS